ncbi:leucyl aminopeptidase [Pacificimonas sp. WHA3]|uniref:Probable cytosol aminopeptidase n=1 Tax=Pacificimonas pallii TaxID=2827236 RepID=A0ABS6SB15_9SPHN|nr:leucyl aminopeptidase [Pacificimonas pallii]MBV7255544.1 leucyl aminopeptidase [Pacificimonas pallii]
MTRFLANAAITIVAVTALAATPAAAVDIDFSAAALPGAGKVVMAVGEDGVLSGAAASADRQMGGALGRAVAAADFDGEAGSSLPLYGLAPYDAVLLVGVGKGLASGADVQDFGGTVAGQTAAWRGDVAVAVPDVEGLDDEAAHAALGARLGSYDFGKWGAAKTAGGGAKGADAAPKLIFHGPGEAAFAGDRRAIADGVAFARDLVSTPSNIKTPEWFAGQVESVFADVPRTSVRVLDVPEMQRLGMGALVGVGQGSARPPRLVAVRYDSPDYDGPPLAFVGKGITFDTGGISLKGGRGMWAMRGDMTGAATAMGAVMALANRGAAVDVIAVAALAENMPGGAAQRPGDVVTTMSGKTIEVLNTDAEGRLVLTDGVWWTQQTYDPRLVVSVATLTGAVISALGDDYAGVFTKDDDLAALFIDAGEVSGETLWRLPVHDNVFEDIKSDVADVKNVVEGGTPSASIGAAFIMSWAREDQPFVHLDIAGQDYTDTPRPTEPKGWTAFGVRLLDEVARRYETK